MNPRELLVLLARFTVTGYGGLVEVRCNNCGTAKTFGVETEDIELPELVIYARDHRCRQDQAPGQRSARRALEAV
jgi:hypothetical protein